MNEFVAKSFDDIRYLLNQWKKLEVSKVTFEGLIIGKSLIKVIRIILSQKELRSFCLNKCVIDEDKCGFLFYSLVGFNYTISITNCNLTAKGGAQILSYTWPYHSIRIILSNNNLSSNGKKKFLDQINDDCFEFLDISGNGFCIDDIPSRFTKVKI